jgi:site-specific recombinase XerD
MKDLLERFSLTLRERGLAKQTQTNYLTGLRRFFKYLGEKDPLSVDQDDIRRYQVSLVDEDLAAKTINLYMAGVRSFYLETLKRDWPDDFLARVKERRKLPELLAPSEVAGLINAAQGTKARVLLMTMYSGGLRPIEVVNLKYQNIDSKRMLLHVELAKGGKNRFVPLSKALLEALRFYWKATPEDKWTWLFPADRDATKPFAKNQINDIIKAAVKVAKIEKPVTARTVRHCFATHLLELGVDLRVIQLLLGHAVISSTEIYTHVRAGHLPEIKNPLDAIASLIDWRR